MLLYTKLIVNVSIIKTELTQYSQLLFFLIFFLQDLLTKTKTEEQDTKDTSTYISQCNSLSLKEKEHNSLQIYLYTT